ncbi:carboxypeptidase-like regulatory domain-containing protein [Myxococcota bacterium]|nr:carboxypeptidase-like regulatory domain-containing protein [Myxococcota bacterium]
MNVYRERRLVHASGAVIRLEPTNSEPSRRLLSRRPNRAVYSALALALVACGVTEPTTLGGTDAGSADLGIDQPPDSGALDAQGDAAIEDSRAVDGGPTCEPLAAENRSLEDRLVVVVSDFSGRAVRGALVRARVGEEYDVTTEADGSGCAVVEAPWLDAGPVRVDVVAPGFAPAVRLGDPSALQRIALLRYGAPRPDAGEVGTAIVEGQLASFDVLPPVGSGTTRVVEVLPILQSPWVNGRERSALDPVTGWPENMLLQTSTGHDDRGYRLTLRVGEHRGIYAHGYVIADFGGSRGVLQVLPLDPPLTAGERLENLDLDLEIPLDRTLDIRADPSIPGPFVILGAVEVPDLGLLRFDTTRNDVGYPVPALEGPLAGGKYAAYAEWYDATSRSKYIKYSGTSTTIEIGADWIWRVEIVPWSDGMLSIAPASTVMSSICDVVLQDSERNVLVTVSSFTNERWIQLPPHPITTDPILFPPRGWAEVECGAFPGWSPEHGDREPFRNQKLVRSYEVTRRPR